MVMAWFVLRKLYILTELVFGSLIHSLIKSRSLSFEINISIINKKKKLISMNRRNYKRERWIKTPIQKNKTENIQEKRAE